MCSVVIGIDSSGRYVVVEFDGRDIAISHLSMEELKNVCRIILTDSIVEVKCDSPVSGRVVRSVLVSFENDLVFIDSAGILNWSFIGNRELIVSVEVTSISITYGEFLNDREKTVSYDTKNLRILMEKD